MWQEISRNRFSCFHHLLNTCRKVSVKLSQTTTCSNLKIRTGTATLNMDYPELKYSFKNLSIRVVEENGNAEGEGEGSSSLDALLTRLWEERMDKDGVFRYKLKKGSLPYKIPPGKFKYIAQLNPDRAVKRRAPQQIQSCNQPFDPDQFHFNKVKEDEVLMRLVPEWGRAEEENAVLINVSPLEYCHVLITPLRNRNRPQKLTKEGLRLGLELALLSNSPDFRVGFNSLCGFASVNHEHWHAYYLSYRLYLESAPLTPLKENLKLFLVGDSDFPPGFCFVLTETDLRKENGIHGFLEGVTYLVRHVQEMDIAHNVYITRGSTSNKEGHFDSVRLFFWVRTSSFGAKQLDAFSPALCEISGHLPIKSEASYATLTEQFVLDELHAICDGPFKTVKQWIESSL